MADQAINVYKKFYPELLEADLPIDNLMKQLQNIKLFTDHDRNELGACDTQTTRAQYIVDHMIKPSINSGSTQAFDVLLNVMEESDNTDLILLAKEMKIMYNSVPNDLDEALDESIDGSIDGLPDESPEQTLTTGNNEKHTMPAADEVDGRVKDMLTSAASAVASKFKKKHGHRDSATTEHRVPSPSTTVRDYTNIKRSLLIIKKYGSRRSHPLGSPWLLAKGAGDKLFVRDYNTHQVVVFDNKLKYSHLIGNEGGFKSIGGIAVNDETQHVYVADQLSNCVKKFKLDGQFVTQIGHKGTGDGEFRSPCGLLVSGTESLFVCDTNNHRIQVFHHNDKFAYAFGQRGPNPGCFEKPEALAMNSTEDKLYISSENKVQVFTISGQFLKVFGHFSDASHKLVTPVGVCCTVDGHILISSYGTHCVHVLKEDGTYVSVIKGSHQGKERFVFPAGVVVRDNGNIVIASSGNHQLVVF